MRMSVCACRYNSVPERARPGRSNVRRQNSRRNSKRPPRYYIAAPGDGGAPRFEVSLLTGAFPKGKSCKTSRLVKEANLHL